MKKENSLIEFVEKLCLMSRLEIEKSSENYFKINTDEASGISLILEIDDSNKLSFYYLQRTHDLFYHGDRSDAHVVLSLIFSAFLRLFSKPISCSLFDIPHPIVDDEIWGRYIMPQQMPSFMGISSREELKKSIKKLITTISIWRHTFWQYAGCPCKECMEHDEIDNSCEGTPDPEIIQCIENLYGNSPHINHGRRMRPNWHYVYDLENEVTLIKSEELSVFLQNLTSINKNNIYSFESKKGELEIDNDLTHFISNKSKKEFRKIFKSLNLDSDDKNRIISLENMLIQVSSPYIVALGRLSGEPEFKLEKEFLRKRHNKESEILFPIPLFTWHEKICPDQFENLIKFLLEREPDVISVRKPAPTNQGDKGRDLLIEWNIIDENIISDVNSPRRKIKVVGQCKTSKSTIGKNKVLDIRDTIETHQSSGFFLAVNTQITAPLTEKLESLKNSGIWTMWWNREDIEFRLAKNQDLIPMFPEVVQVKHKIRFVDKN